MNHDGRLVKLEHGGWAQFKRVPVAGIAGLTVLVAVEVEPTAQARLNANGAQAEAAR